MSLLNNYIRTNYGIAKVIEEKNDKYVLNKAVIFNDSNGDLSYDLHKDVSQELAQIELYGLSILKVLKPKDYANGGTIIQVLLDRVRLSIGGVTGECIGKNIYTVLTQEEYNRLSTEIQPATITLAEIYGKESEGRPERISTIIEKTEYDFIYNKTTEDYYTTDGESIDLFTHKNEFFTRVFNIKR